MFTLISGAFLLAALKNVKQECCASIGIPPTNYQKFGLEPKRALTSSRSVLEEVDIKKLKDEPQNIKTNHWIEKYSPEVKNALHFWKYHPKYCLKNSIVQYITHLYLTNHQKILDLIKTRLEIQFVSCLK